MLHVDLKLNFTEGFTWVEERVNYLWLYDIFIRNNHTIENVNKITINIFMKHKGLSNMSLRFTRKLHNSKSQKNSHHYLYSGVCSIGSNHRLHFIVLPVTLLREI